MLISLMKILIQYQKAMIKFIDIYKLQKSFMIKDQNHLALARKDFDELKQGCLIPPKMQIKLDYLLASVLEQDKKKEIVGDDLPEYEKVSLDLLNMQTKLQLFCNIVNCLSGKNVILYFKDEKAYIRKDQTFSMWSKCYITCDSQTVSIRKKPQKKPLQEFTIIDLRISKRFREYKRKIVFGIIYKKKQSYLIGFDQESACVRVHEILRNLIREKVQQAKGKKQQKTKIISEQKCLMVENQQQSQIIIQTEQKQENIGEEGESVQMFSRIKKQQFENNQEYRVLRHFQKGRFLVHRKYPNKIKSVIILDKSTPLNILQCYMQMNQWNSEVQDMGVSTKLCHNNYLMWIRFKRYSYFSWSRYASVIVSFFVDENKHYLSITNVEEQDNGDSKDAVKMCLNQIIEVCKNPNNYDEIVLSIITEADHRGYCSLEDSKNMTLKILNSLEFFSQFVRSQQITERSQRYFNFTKWKPLSLAEPPSQSSQIKKSQLRKSSACSDLQVSDMIFPKNTRSDVMSQKDREQEMQQFQPSKEDVDITMFMMFNDDNKTIDEELIYLIQKKKLHEKYYLTHHFDQIATIEPERYEHEAEGPGNYMFQNGNWKLSQEKQLVFINQQVIKVQKEIFKYILKQLSSNFMSGKSIMTMSLPVQIFQKRSMLERLAMGMGYAPKFLVPAAQTEDLVKQAELVTLFINGIACLHINVSKPFNPILGQTFEAKIGGIPIYMEQISHHPPISAVYMKTDTFSFYGSFNSHVDLGLNSAIGKNLNLLYVKIFKTNTLYEVKVAEMQISGIMFGDRKYRPCSKTFIHEKTNDLWIELSYGKEKKKVYQYNGKVKPNTLLGGIYTVTKKFSKKYNECEVKRKFQGVTVDDIIQKHTEISGHWALDIYFNDKLVKEMSNPIPNKLQYPKYVLPSDSNFRPDIIYKRMDNLRVANEEKQVLENLQRRDRKLRSGEVKPA